MYNDSKIFCCLTCISKRLHAPYSAKVKQTAFTAATCTSVTFAQCFLLLLKAERLMEAIELYKEETTKMEEQSSAYEKVSMT